MGGVSMSGGMIGSRFGQPRAQVAVNAANAVVDGQRLAPTVCEICFWKCRLVDALDGKPWKITGNPEDPNCNGRLCPRDWRIGHIWMTNG
ncbi:MAG: hypothetical protein R3C26_05620 [Calditrichia bacterium]